MDFTPLTDRVRGPFCELRTGFFAKHAGRESKGKERRIRNLKYGPSKIYYISTVSVAFRNDFTRSGFKFLNHDESKTSQFEIVVKSLAGYNTQFFE